MSTQPLDRNSRQALLVPADKVAAAHAVVIGVGAVGHRLALLLADMGVGRLTVVDHDTVEVVNLAPQGYRENQMGQNKAAAAAEDCRTQNPAVTVTPVPRRFGKSDYRMLEGAHVFACVDSIDGRRLLHEAAVKAASPWLGDARVAGDVLQVITAAAPTADGPYAATLFAQEDAFRGTCAATRMSTYGAATAAALLAASFAHNIRGVGQPFNNQTLSLITWDLIETPPAKKPARAA